MIENFITLGMLILLQAVLGFDNLLYVSLESKRAPEDKQDFVRKLGIGLAIILRIVLLFVLIAVIDLFQDPFWTPHWPGVFEGAFNVHSIIVLGGGVFIISTAMKEILPMLRLEEEGEIEREPRSTGMVIFWIVLMNLVFRSTPSSARWL